MADSPDVTAAKRLLDLAKDRGFAFARIAPGDDGPLQGVRETVNWLDDVYLGGFWQEDSCHATRRHRYFLIVPGSLPVTERVTGDALTVLHHDRAAHWMTVWIDVLPGHLVVYEPSLTLCPESHYPEEAVGAGTA